MEVIEGAARRMRMGTETTVSNQGARTTHIATFQMGKVPVRLEMPRAIMLGEGDAVAVAGLQNRDGVFEGLAYRNMDTGARGQACGWAHVLGGTVFSIVGIGGALLIVLGAVVGSDSESARWATGAFASIFMAAFGGPGLNMLRKVSRTRRAQAALN